MRTTLLFACRTCGTHRFEVPIKPKSDDMVTCVQCGTTARFDEAVASGRRETRKQAEKGLREIDGNLDESA